LITFSLTSSDGSSFFPYPEAWMMENSCYHELAISSIVCSTSWIIVAPTQE
jgi:hypothetical protein